MMTSSCFTLPVRVYYEDTDAGGVVYYAKYLHYFERARTEWLRSFGFEQHAMLRDSGLAFAVRSAQVDYLRPARLDDELTIVSAIIGLGRAQITFAQHAERNGEVLVDAKIKVACFDPARGKAAAMPKDIFQKLETLLGTPA